MTMMKRTHDQFGVVEWFRTGDYERAESVLSELGRSGAAFLRTQLSWAEYLTEGGPAWFDWLLPKLAERFEVLPCIHYTPPSLSRTGKSSGAPVDLKSYADFVDHVIDRYGRCFRHIELWNEPNNLLDWDWREDSDFQLFCEMVGGAAYWVKQRGYKPVLAGPCPFDPTWVELMGERGVLSVVDAVGFHAFPGTWDSEEGPWGGWDMHLGEMRKVLDRHNRAAEIWVTETGYSTWRNDEIEQVSRFSSALNVPAERVYWYAWRDVPPHIPVQEGLWFDMRHYHLGAVRHDGQPKLLARLLQEGGVDRVREIAQLSTPHVASDAAPVVITGGSGFIGANLADSFLKDGHEVLVVDNLARPGVEKNLEWLKAEHGPNVHTALIDIRNRSVLDEVVSDASAVFHFAAQTAVTTSLVDPIDDFETNARGTINLLEAVRKAGRRAPVVFASTNKVYGSLEDIELSESEDQYAPSDLLIRKRGIGEWRGLDFSTPYGCSKGVADQYVLDYAKSFGVPTAVMRMSCIYGQRQMGTEDQGWVAHFLIRALSGEPLVVYGDGKQVRDILHINDAVSAYRKLHATLGWSKGQVAGKAFNLGGGPRNAVSLRMLLDEVAAITGKPVDIAHADWRTGDQRYYVSDTQRLEDHVGWAPRIGWRDGVRHLAEWLCSNRFGGRSLRRAERQRVPA